MQKLTTRFELRITTFVITLIMSMVGINAFAHDIEVANADGVTIYYNFINNQTELEVSYRGSHRSSYSDEYNSSVVIPESVIYNGMAYAVTNIGEYAFYMCDGLTSVNIPNSVTSIGSSAFLSCIVLSEVIIEDGENTLSFSRISGQPVVFHDCPIESLYLGRTISYSGSFFRHLETTPS